MDSTGLSTSSRPVTTSCRPCRASKRRCDRAKPRCSTCQKGEKLCVYDTEAKPRKRKYWDEDYVRSLEHQVQTLLALQENRGHSISSASDPSSIVDCDASGASDAEINIPHVKSPRRSKPADDGNIEDRSSVAMEELSTMMWRTNLGDGVTIVNEEHGKLAIANAERRHPAQPDFQLPLEMVPYCADRGRLHRLARLFLENINGEHQFTPYRSTDFLVDYPNQPRDQVFLHSAMLATGATFEQAPDSLLVGDTFAGLCESLAFTCVRQNPSLSLIRGLCILSWRSLALGRDQFGWIFLSMAAGMAVHLRLHVLALGEFASPSDRMGLQEVQTFWSFFMTDRTSISILGRNCVLPWRRVNVPPIEAFTAGNQGDLMRLSFAWQCKMWHMHDRNMDQIFSHAFEKLSFSSQVQLLISTHEDLNTFIKSCDERLRMNRGITPKPVLLFHMAYQMAILVTMPPFLQLFIRIKNKRLDASSAMSLVLRSISNASSSMVRLVHLYRQHYGFRHANPLLIHHLLSAAIVNLMNTTSKSLALRRHSTRSVRKCLTLLQELRLLWPVRCDKSIAVITALAKRWGVEYALQSQFETPLEGDTCVTQHPERHLPPSTSGLYPTPDLLPPEAFGANETLGYAGQLIPDWDFSADQPLLGVADVDIFSSLQGFENIDDLGWAF
ncbi:hypothetical protein BO70DRAFT_394653 [Aspergillus heteromorphus CBS 117.55]|uniref:Zn(2)-C6 fungal-type domain-containing protein n=1 Tax=Aspergillus heteromorphus CBS 117.55 TaxID=1448321 RepID=A0A317WNX8_9EURO|nr:uncharacterized protein BO70DRAFT_394653 [Aspergillus heteromorphus CBS 117.55]PWY86638.1 hypothetical protein BO70DRAFT_394653 [Aspergillus heteromorphus CBS 117.55]